MDPSKPLAATVWSSVLPGLPGGPRGVLAIRSASCRCGESRMAHTACKLTFGLPEAAASCAAATRSAAREAWGRSVRRGPLNSSGTEMLCGGLSRRILNSGVCVAACLCKSNVETVGTSTALARLARGSQRAQRTPPHCRQALIMLHAD